MIYVPGHYDTIQEAIAGSQDGDSIIVKPGTYYENLDFLGRAITLTGEQGAASTIIDGGQPQNPDYGSVVVFQNHEGPDSVIKGFTLTNGVGSNPSIGSDRYGGGIICFRSSPTIINNVITNNIVIDQIYHWADGGGIYCFSSQATIMNNMITDNLATNEGGGICCEKESAPLIKNNFISGNKARSGSGISCDNGSSPQILGNILFKNSYANYGGGVLCSDDTAPVLINNLIFENEASQGGGICCEDFAEPKIINCTIVANTGDYGGGLCCNWSSPAVSNSIFWGNSAVFGPEVALRAGYFTSELTINYSVVQDGLAAVDIETGCSLLWGTGMITDDPLFVDLSERDFHLQQDPCQPGLTNPCVNAGDSRSLLLEGSTRSDGERDRGIVDLGFHYPAEGGPDLSLTSEPFVAGFYSLISVQTPSQFEKTYLTFSIQGMGTTPVPFLGLELDIDSPEQIGDIKLTDSEGKAIWSVLVPPSCVGLGIWIQAMQFGQVSNVVCREVQ